MHRSKVNKLLLFTALAVFAAPAAGAPAPARATRAVPAPAYAAAIEAVMKEALKSAPVGAVVGITEKGQVRYLRSFGTADLEHAVPVKNETVFRIGSVTKQFTAAGVMLLAERGKLSLADKVSKYFPGFARGDEVTLRELLNHTSGSTDYTGIPSHFSDVRTERSSEQMEELVLKLTDYDFEPGTAWKYNNSGYILLGRVIEKVSGQPFDRFIAENILRPLDMRDTAMDADNDIVPNRAEGYSLRRNPPSGFMKPFFLSTSNLWAAGGYRSTVQDLLKWHMGLFGGKLLKPESVAAMIEPARVKDGRLTSLARSSKEGRVIFDYGLGFIVEQHEGKRMLGHGGGLPGFNAWIRTLPTEDMTIVILTNTDGTANALGPKLVSAALAARGTR